MERKPLNKHYKKLIIRLGLGLMGVGMAGIIMLVIFTLFPALRPDFVTFTVGTGDIFYNHPEWVVQPDDMDEVLSTHRLVWDEDGFRVPHWQAEQYPIIALGDSFTDGLSVAMPWPDILAETLETPVRNLGFRGHGPVEQAEMLRLYRGDDGDAYVILGFFEGNDLRDVVTSDPDNIILPIDVDDFTIEELYLEDVDVVDERYPMQIVLGDAEKDVAFFEWYVWNLNSDVAFFEELVALELSAEYWREMQNLAGDACFIIAYLPSKPHIYLPYLEPESQERLISFAASLAEEDDEQPSFEVLLERVGALRDAVEARVIQEGIVFFDTTPFLQATIAGGQVPYYAYDTHWNQLGHEVVGKAIADYLQTNPCG